MASMKAWIEKDALKSLRGEHTPVKSEEATTATVATGTGEPQQPQQPPQQDSTNTIANTNLFSGPRTAKIVSLGTGWTAAGVNLTLGKMTSNPFPSMTITDGRHEVVAYLATETAQSTAFFTRPALSPGSRVELEKLEFVPETSLAPETQVNSKHTPFALAVHGPVKLLGPAPPVINLNFSKKFSREVGFWINKATSSNSINSQDNPNTQPMPTLAVTTTTVVPTDQKEETTTNHNKDDHSVASGHSTDSTETVESLNSVDGRPRRERNSRNRMSWEEKLQFLKSYKEEFGHCNAPPGYKRGKFALGTWVNSLRTGRDELSEERKKELKKMGFVFNLAEHNWNNNLEVLKEFKKENGHTSVPISYKDPVSGLKLGCWVYNQRQAWKNNKMKPDRKKRLEKMGFEFVCAVARKRNSNAN